MSKRNKKSRSNRSAFKLEALEQRQLLATIISGGTEVLSNIKTLASDGLTTNTYDQVVLTGSSVAVKADAGQVVRVDWLDADGDIVRAEFSGSGTMGISLAGATTAQAASKYTTANTYMQGNATVTITGSDATTNVQLYSIGKGTAFNGINNPIFADPTKIGGSHNMNMAALVVLADNTSVGNNFNDVRAANVIFGATQGVIGIAATDISFKGVINIGDIVADGTASPLLKLGAFTDTTKVTVAGGALKAATTASNAAITVASANVNTIAVQNNVDSNGTAVVTQVITLPTGNNKAGVALASSNVSYSSGLGTVTVDGTTATTTSLDALYSASFLQDVIITGGLASGVVFHALQFGNVTVNGDLAGLITTDVNNSNTAQDSEQSIGNVTINGNIVDKGGIESAQTIGAIKVTGKVTHTIVTPNAAGVFTTIGKTTADASIGTIDITGDVNIGVGTLTAGTGVTSAITTDAESLVSAATLGATTLSGTVGNITIGGALNTWTAGAIAIRNQSGVTAGSIGNIAVTGDVVLSTNGVAAIQSGKAIGNISGKTVSLINAGAGGSITAADAIGTITSNTGNINILAGGTITAAKKIGNITAATNLIIGANIASTGDSIGNLVATSGDIAGGAARAAAAGTVTGNKGVGNITLSGAGAFGYDSTASVAGAAAVGLISNVTGNIGNISVADASTNGVTIANGITSTAGNVGTITVTKGNLTVTSLVQAPTAAKTIGDITVTAGDVSLTGAGKFVAGGAIGNVTVSAGSITSTTAAVEFQGNSIGNVSVTGKATTATLLTDVIFSAKGTTAALIGTSKIGDITLNSSANTSGDISTSAGASVSNVTGTGFSSSGNIGNITITTGSVAGAEVVAAGKALVFRAGSSEMGAQYAGTAAGELAAGGAVNAAQGAAATDAVENVSIGNVTITGYLTGANFNGGNGAGTGLQIISGAKIATNGVWSAASGTTGLDTLASAQTYGSIGNITLNDAAGNITRTAFNNALVAATVSDAGGSIILAEKIGGLTVNSGSGAILSLSGLTGLPLQGVLGTGLTSTGAQTYVGATTDNLLVVVL